MPAWVGSVAQNNCGFSARAFEHRASKPELREGAGNQIHQRVTTGVGGQSTERHGWQDRVEPDANAIPQASAEKGAASGREQGMVEHAVVDSSSMVGNRERQGFAERQHLHAGYPVR
jgi:hypothetical protein